MDKAYVSARVHDPQRAKTRLLEASHLTKGLPTGGWNPPTTSPLVEYFKRGRPPRIFLCVFTTGSGLQVPAGIPAGARSRKDTKEGVGPT